MTLYHKDMPDQSSKRRKQTDLNKLASAVVSEATEEEKAAPEPERRKNPAAVELGRKGGLKGGKARAEKLTPEERTEIARIAAEARWHR